MKVGSEQGKRKQVKKNETKSAGSSKSDIHNSPHLGPSGLQINPVSEDFDSESSVDSAEETVTCCQCNRFESKELEYHLSLIFVKWAEYDFSGCNHWTHLRFCCKQRVIRRGDMFFCPCNVQQYLSVT